jgi:3-oxoacyl-[acyl-carrier-protein] synthase-3
MYTQGHSRIVSTGVYIPAQRITTREIMEQLDSANRFDVPYDWLERVTGIREKRVTPEGVMPSDMAVIAAKEALERAGIGSNEIDAIIYTGATRDYSVEPATAHVVQAKLHASNATVFDVSNACHGFMNGIHLMDALIATGQVRRGLVVTGEQGKLFTQKAIEILRGSRERRMFVDLAAGLTLGDAGAAMLMGPKLGPDSGFMGFMLRSQGQHASVCTSGGLLREGPVITDMPAIVAESTKLIAAMFQEFLYKRLKWRIEDLSKYVIHQVGGNAFKLHSQILGVPLDIIPKTVGEMGNLITANIPLCIHNFSINQEVNDRDKIYLSGVGSGISLSQAGLIWEAA